MKKLLLIPIINLVCANSKYNALFNKSLKNSNLEHFHNHIKFRNNDCEHEGFDENDDSDDDLGPNRSGLDDSKYLELPTDQNGNIDLPEQANYSGTVGANLLKYVKPGDILYDSIGAQIAFGYTGHVAIIEGIHYSQTYNQNYIMTIEANPNHGVKRGYVDVDRFNDSKTILRINTSQSAISSAIYFCYLQLDKDYLFHTFSPSQDPDAVHWYCSELIWAAYKFTGVDLSNNHSSNVPIYPSYINADSDTHNIMKYDSETFFSNTNTQHTYLCDGDSFTENHNQLDSYNGMPRCSICGHIFWPSC